MIHMADDAAPPLFAAAADDEPPPIFDVNTSGTSGPLPPEVDAMAFNAGAFFGGFVWALGNRAWAGLMDILWYVVLPVLPVWRTTMALRGYEWAWRARHWDSVEQFSRVQRRWGWIGLGVALAQLIAATALFVKYGTTFVPAVRSGGG